MKWEWIKEIMQGCRNQVNPDFERTKSTYHHVLLRIPIHYLHHHSPYRRHHPGQGAHDMVLVLVTDLALG